jgi:putative transposase
MCQLLEVSRSSYYDWLKRAPLLKDSENEKLANKIKEIFQHSRGNYGTRRIKRALAKEDFIVSRRRIGCFMKQLNLHCKTKKKFKMTTDSNHNLPIAPNLLGRNFEVQQPNQCYVGDITYVPTEEGWLYLAVVIDLFSRQVVGWSMEKHMKTSLVNQALLMALWKRKPNRGLIWHTDRGSQYASDSHRMLLKNYSIIQSMARKGDCWDNAVAESFFHTLKVELIHQYKFKSIEEAKKAIFEYIEVFYNRIRMHSSNNYLSPVEFENLKVAS